MSTPNTTEHQGPERNNPEKKGLFLNYKDFKKIEKIIESYNLFEKSEDVDFNNMPDDEKEILWKIKTIIRNMESVRLRPTGDPEEK